MKSGYLKNVKNPAKRARKVERAKHSLFLAIRQRFLKYLPNDLYETIEIIIIITASVMLRIYSMETIPSDQVFRLNFHSALKALLPKQFEIQAVTTLCRTYR